MIRKLFSPSNKTRRPQSIGRGAPQFLVAGLGNPGLKYEGTRHNVGFSFVDLLAEKEGFPVKKLKFQSLYGDVQLAGVHCLVMKPQTFMNNSGIAIRQAADFYKIPPERVIVLFDDVTLPPGSLRIRRQGSDGGHNGIKSILYHLGSDQFPRIKIGVGKKPHPNYDLAAWVLSGFSRQEAELVEEALEHAIDALELMLQGKIEEAMNRYN